eukprot:1060678-Prymnesium_polylepis.1
MLYSVKLSSICDDRRPTRVVRAKAERTCLSASPQRSVARAESARPPLGIGVSGQPPHRLGVAHAPIGLEDLVLDTPLVAVDRHIVTLRKADR